MLPALELRPDHNPMDYLGARASLGCNTLLFLPKSPLPADLGSDPLYPNPHRAKMTVT
jgi:hypothetical protein